MAPGRIQVYTRVLSRSRKASAPLPGSRQREKVGRGPFFSQKDLTSDIQWGAVRLSSIACTEPLLPFACGKDMHLHMAVRSHPEKQHVLSIDMHSMVIKIAHCRPPFTGVSRKKCALTRSYASGSHSPRRCITCFIRSQVRSVACAGLAVRTMASAYVSCHSWGLRTSTKMAPSVM